MLENVLYIKWVVLYLGIDSPKQNHYVKSTSYQVHIRNDWKFRWNDFTSVLND